MSRLVRYRRESIHSSTTAASTGIGSEPWSSSSAWKPGRSKAGPSSLVAFSRTHATHDGQVFAITVMAIAASEVVVGLGIVVALSHLRRELDTDELAELRG